MSDSQPAPAGQARLPVGLAAYSFGYLCGFVGSSTARACPDPYDAYRLMDLAVAHGLGGVEFPPHWSLPGLTRADLEQARAYADARDLFIVIDGGVVDVKELRALLPAAAALGAGVVRVIASDILCGDRRAVRETWPAYLAEIVGRLRAVRDLAEEMGVAIALENHQDVTSAELLEICTALDSPCIGVTLDAINPLAVVEDPLAFARRVAPFIKNVHLKDYRVYNTSEGYRLARCAVGAGVLNVAEVCALLAREAPRAAVSIELGALQARHVRFLADDFWPGYPPRRVEDILPVLRLRDEHGRPGGEEWRTPWERDVSAAELAAFELGEIEESVAFLRGMMA